MASSLESRYLLKMARPFMEFTRHLEGIFPQLEWDLKRSGYTINAQQYLAVSIYISIVVFVGGFIIIVAPFLFTTPLEENYIGIGVSVFFSIAALGFLLINPKLKITSRGNKIDKNLEYVLKDMHIQLTSGVPLFDTFVNIARGDYGEVSSISENIIREVESGRSMGDVLDDVGMWSPSEHYRQSLWQIVNALRSGSDVSNALDAISKTIRMEKQNQIRAYAQELNLWGLIYMMAAVVVPSMGVTLLVILSSFMGGQYINERLFWIILAGLIVFQVVFISFIRSKRPSI